MEMVPRWSDKNMSVTVSRSSFHGQSVLGSGNGKERNCREVCCGERRYNGSGASRAGMAAGYGR